MSGSVRIVGVHPIHYSRDFLRDAMRVWHGPDTHWESEEELEDEVESWEPQIRDTMEGLHMIELIAETDLDSWNAGRLSQDDPQTPNSQAVYDEHYLNDDGTEVVSHDKPQGSRFRMAFFLHGVEFAKPLYGPWGSVAIPRPTPLPERLARLVPYEPAT